jgi:UDP-N-acetylglucosamine 2-epimerase (non-hydrolysing)
MPEEINRMLTDCISDYLFCTEMSGYTNLIKEGVPREKIFLVGNVMIDTLIEHKKEEELSSVMDDLDVDQDNFCLMTLHRPSNVDSPDAMNGIFKAIEFIEKDTQIIFPVHPRTYQNIISFDMEDRVRNLKNLKIVEPLGYLDFLKLMVHSKFILTDSGGIQEESMILRKPCLTLRDNTERPSTISAGLNQLVGNETDKIIEGYQKIKTGDLEEDTLPLFWDGKTSKRIVDILEKNT